MEQNSFSVSLYVDATPLDVYEYIGSGMSLNEWTLFSKMIDQVDDDTWLGTASGYQRTLYYHRVRRQFGDVRIVEWHCGFEIGNYHHVYPMVVFPANYVGSDEKGAYFHWLSFVDPRRRNAAISEGILTVHRTEARSMKAALERRRGRKSFVEGVRELATHTIYVDAPYRLTVDYLSELTNAAEWGYLFRSSVDSFVDEYERPFSLTLRTHDLGDCAVVEHDVAYSGAPPIRSPLFIYPASYAFSTPQASGVIMHRLSFWDPKVRPQYGKQSVDDYNTEAISAKRVLEAKAGNLEAFARGNSYLGL